MGWLGLDDTDSLAGGCTTKVMEDLLQNLPQQCIVGEVRLVRLWPFASGRTRGNAALGVSIDCDDENELISHLDHWWNNEIVKLKGLISPSHHSNRPQVPSDPGMVWFSEQPDESFYWDAVRHHVDIDDQPEATKTWGGLGVIGAIAAVSWRGKEATWEAIAWRRSQTSTQPRSVCPAALVEIDSWDDTFLSRDPRSGTSLVAPRGLSPVLCGVRATTRDIATKALAVLLESEHTESFSGCRTYKTNQATGDHLLPSTVAVIEEVLVDEVRKHARLITSHGEWVAFGEGGPVNQLARWLQQGDRVEMRGLQHPNGSYHLEQLRAVAWNARKKQRPLCSQCGQRMKSMGRNQGLRCPTCKWKCEDSWDDIAVQPPFEGWVEPPASSRRHLSRPLSWG